MVPKVVGVVNIPHMVGETEVVEFLCMKMKVVVNLVGAVEKR